jgi:hypothetical protein
MAPSNLNVNELKMAWFFNNSLQSILGNDMPSSAQARLIMEAPANATGNPFPRLFNLPSAIVHSARLRVPRGASDHIRLGCTLLFQSSTPQGAPGLTVPEALLVEADEVIE